jgi:hypothetical protein
MGGRATFEISMVSMVSSDIGQRSGQKMIPVIPVEALYIFPNFSVRALTGRRALVMTSQWRGEGSEKTSNKEAQTADSAEWKQTSVNNRNLPAKIARILRHSERK